MLAGTLHHMDHKTFTHTVEVYGGTVVTKLADADFLVLGTKPGKKVEEARDAKVVTLTEAEFFDEIGADYSEPVAKKAKK